MQNQGEDHGPTVFKNHLKCRIWSLAFYTNFCHIKSDLSGNIVWPQASGFQKIAKIDHFLHFDELCDFFFDFQTLCIGQN